MFYRTTSVARPADDTRIRRGDRVRYRGPVRCGLRGCTLRHIETRTGVVWRVYWFGWARIDGMPRPVRTRDLTRLVP